MENLALNLFLIILPLFWMAFPVFMWVAKHNLRFLYKEDVRAIGVKLKEKRYGPTFSDAKEVMKMTKDEHIKENVLKSIRLFRISYACLVLFFCLLLIIGILDN